MIEGEPPAKDLASEHIIWDGLMNDETIDEISVRFRKDRVLLRWRYSEGPNHYRWFDL